MRNSIHPLNRILVVGREVGSIARLLKKTVPKVTIGAVDVLGNEETRYYADWKFSVVKQVPEIAIQRPKHRPLLDLLYELTKVMLEDLEFDLLIPTSPFQSKPVLIQQLSQEVQVLAPNNKMMEQVSSANSFLTKIFEISPEIIPSPIRFSSISETVSNHSPMLFVTEEGIQFFSNNMPLTSIGKSNNIGFLLPLPQIHCALFIGSNHSLKFLGFQTLISPYDHPFFLSYLERNGFIPFSLPRGFTIRKIISFLSNVISILNLNGIITIYFGMTKHQIFPVSCNVLPDENFDLWEIRTSKTLIDYLLSLMHKTKSISISSNFAFKLPIYSQRPIRVPNLSKTLVGQRNLDGVISNPEYPICSLLETTSSSLAAQQLLNQKKKEILEILHPIE